MTEPDDLTRLDDTPLTRALRAPGTPAELADEDRYVAMFREAGPKGGGTPGPRRGAARRFGTGTALTLVIAAAGGGVAAAYTGRLPDPIQDFAHVVLGPIAPAAEPRTDPRGRSTAPPPATASSSPSPSSSVSGVPQPDPTPSPSTQNEPADQPGAKGPSDRPSEQPTETGSARPSPTPTQTTSPSPTPEPSPTPPPPPPAGTAAAVSITGTAHRVDVGEAQAFSGVVTAKDGSPVAGMKVALQRRHGERWVRVARGTTDDSGSVVLGGPPVTENTTVRLRTRGARSEPWRIAAHPLLSLTSAPGDAEGSVVITATAEGGHAGDRVQLSMRLRGGPVKLGVGVLDASGSVQFEVSPPKRRVAYGALLERTERHTADRARIVVTRPPPPEG